MKHMTSYIFNKDIKTIDDAATLINNKLMGPVITMNVRVSRKGDTTMFITTRHPGCGTIQDWKWHEYEVAKLDDLLKIICDDLSLLEACVRHEIVIPK